MRAVSSFLASEVGAAKEKEPMIVAFGNSPSLQALHEGRSADLDSLGRGPAILRHHCYSGTTHRYHGKAWAFIWKTRWYRCDNHEVHALQVLGAVGVKDVTVEVDSAHQGVDVVKPLQREEPEARSGLVEPPAPLGAAVRLPEGEAPG